MCIALDTQQPAYLLCIMEIIIVPITEVVCETQINRYNMLRTVSAYSKHSLPSCQYQYPYHYD